MIDAGINLFTYWSADRLVALVIILRARQIARVVEGWTSACHSSDQQIARRRKWTFSPVANLTGECLLDGI
jgi:hypothetical protein